MFGLRTPQDTDELVFSRLLNQDDFYDALGDDLARARREVVIESPFVSFKRLNYLLPVFRRLARRKVRVVINTKPPDEQEADYGRQAEECIAILEELGVDVLVTGGHHRKLAIIDMIIDLIL